jgi:hypothetical protein
MKKYILLSLLAYLFTGCSSKNENINYNQTVFIIDKSIELTKNDFKKIKYKKIGDDTYAGYYILTKNGNKKMYSLFKNEEGKHFGIIINNKILNFNTKIIDNIFDKEYAPNNSITFQFKTEEMKLFLKSLGLNLNK